jgi:hypothetical protein
MTIAAGAVVDGGTGSVTAGIAGAVVGDAGAGEGAGTVINAPSSSVGLTVVYTGSAAGICSVFLPEQLQSTSAASTNTKIILFISQPSLFR